MRNTNGPAAVWSTATWGEQFVCGCADLLGQSDGNRQLSERYRGDCDSITILRAQRRQLAKLIDVDGSVTDYDSARLFDLAAVRLTGLEALGLLLRRLTNRPDCCVVRGGIADPSRTRKVRRLLHGDPATGDAPTLRDEPRRWLALDIDGVPRPQAIAAGDLRGCAQITRELLPSELRAADCIVQATASHGIKPGIRMRLWYWLARPVTTEELRHWLRGAPVDHAVFSPAQLIYTAAPLFVKAARNPLIDRIAALPGMAEVVAVPPASALLSLRQARAVRSRIPDGRALAGLVLTVARAAEGERNAITFWAACRAGEMAASGLLAVDTAAAVIADAAMLSGLPRAEAERTALSGVRTGMGSVPHA